MPKATRRFASLLLAVLLVLGGPPVPALAGQAGPVPTAQDSRTEIAAAGGAVHSAGRFDLRTLAAGKTVPSAERRDIAGAIVAPAADTQSAPSRQRASVAADVPTPPAPVFAPTVARDPIDRGGWEGWTQASADVVGSSPIDPSIAVGPEHVMHSASRMLLVTDRQGGDALEISWGDFFEVPPTTLQDPRIVYDELHGRWIATEASWDCTPPGPNTVGVGYLDFAISATADPTGVWDSYYIPWIDKMPTIPAVGTSTTMVSLVAQIGPINMVCGGTGWTYGWEAFAFDWSSLLAHPSTLPYVDSEIHFWESLRPALQTPATSPNLFFVGTTEYSGITGGGEATYLRVTGTVAAHTASFATATNLTATGLVASMWVGGDRPDQPGGHVEGGVPYANTNVVWQSGRLISTLTQSCFKPVQLLSEQCFRVTELSTATTTPTLVQDFYIVPTDGGGDLNGDAYLGGAALSDDGTLHLVWSQSSEAAGDYISTYAARQLPGDPPNTIGTPELVGHGESTYTPSTGWGNYQAIASDPQIPTAIWQGAPRAGSDGTWVTTVSRLQPDGTTYVPIDPVRVLDSRIGVGLSGQFSAKSARSWQVAGVGGIPANAVGVTGNVTVTRQQAVGSVSITPTNTNSPSTSTLNFPVGDNRANNVAVALSSSGSLSAVYGGPAGKKTDLIFDVSGYFVADDSGATFTPITPVRVLDSRTGNGLNGVFARGVPRTLPLAGTHGIPAEATAITGNLTVTGQTAPGSLSVTQTPTASPSTSSLNFPKADNRANGVYAPLDGSGALSIVYMAAVAGSTTNVILDVTGYFVPGTGGLHYFPLNPGRVMDTRPGVALSGLSGLFTSGTPRTLDVGGHWGVPSDAQAITGNLTVTGQTGVGSVAMTFSPTSSPSTSTLNFPIGDNRANGVAGPLNAGAVSFVFNGPATKKTQLILDISGYFQ